MTLTFFWKWLVLAALLVALVFGPAGRVDAPLAWVLLGSCAIPAI